MTNSTARDDTDPLPDPVGGGWRKSALNALVVVAAIFVITGVMRWQYHRGFHAGVGTALCSMDAALGNSMSRECASLNDRQRSYAVRVGREIADPHPNKDKPDDQ